MMDSEDLSDYHSLEDLDKKESCTCWVERNHTLKCFNNKCEKTWEEPVPAHVRTTQCAVRRHRSLVAVCYSDDKKLCKTCNVTHMVVTYTDKDSYVPKYKVVMKDK